jgi:hypothetical protein
MTISERRHVSMLTRDTAGKLSQFHWHWRFVDARCLMKNDDHGPQGVKPPVIPYAGMRRARVYTGTRETGSYNHHSQLTKYQGRYFFAFSNGYVDEEAEGQRIMIASSADAKTWSEAQCVVGGEPGTTLVHNCVALHAAPDALYIVDWREEALRDAESVGMRRILPESNRLHLLRSTDGAAWEQVKALDPRIKVIFEAPRRTAEGRLICICSTTDHGPGLLMWPDGNVMSDPELIALPQAEDALFPYGEGSWYQLDSGRIIVFWRDEGGSCRCYVSYSDDGGRTLTPPMMSDIPDSMSRNYAGRLRDGRYFLVNNAIATLLDRRHLILLLSDDGLTFNKVYNLVDDPTSQRLKGLLKADGYQYPCCLVDGDRLLVGYSVNKEDIECGTVDIGKI